MSRRWQTSTMLRHATLAALLLVCPLCSLAQQRPPVSSPTPDTIKPATLPLDSAKLITEVRASYYHPDELSGLDCKVSIDWPAFFAALKTTVPADRLKALQGLTTHVQTTRGKMAEFTFDWAGGVLDKKEEMEAGIKQMVGGFYQMYWPMIASFPIHNSAEVNRIEPQPDGGATIKVIDQSGSLVLTTDKDYVPVHYTFDTPALKGTIDSEYTASPNPVPGDLRRINTMKVSEQFGTSMSVNMSLDLDYQAVGGIYIPQHVTFDLPGAYSVKMAFSGCSVSRELTVAPPSK